jgi:hypothetical protein
MFQQQMQPFAKPPLLDVIGNIMTALFDPLLHPVPRDAEIGYPQVVQPDPKTRRLHLAQQVHIAETSQCGLKRKILPPLGQLAQALQHDATRLVGRFVRRKRRQPGGDEVGVHELRAIHFLRQETFHIG